MSTLLTKEYALRFFYVESGVVRCRCSRKRSSVSAGDVVGSKNKGEYMQTMMSINGTRFNIKCHHISWIMNNGAIPDGYIIDHRDGNKTNNDISNLRLATHSQNKMNTSVQKNNSTGVKGVHLCSRSGKFIARVQHCSNRIIIGRFDNLNDAETAVKDARIKYHGEFSMD